eukprot:CAMPEP_0173328022 /NCGR_PEP_ID=MMETSP1144-20121109/1929_1 /TAXON_ID=483371 /ORGANISM="non described non described, Strain CCMP2298" /LENGTH=144 /DNA_ID=CAMNT_0014272475 /DNA_START=43 /DNA_END=478 /DNA_ORIENTATION=-
MRENLDLVDSVLAPACVEPRLGGLAGLGGGQALCSVHVYVPPTPTPIPCPCPILTLPMHITVLTVPPNTVPVHILTLTLKSVTYTPTDPTATHVPTATNVVDVWPAEKRRTRRVKLPAYACIAYVYYAYTAYIACTPLLSGYRG